MWHKSGLVFLTLAALGLAGCKPAPPPAPPPPPPASLEVVTNLQFTLPQRKQALRSLVQTPAGARQVVECAKADRLPVDLRLMAALELAHLPWPEVTAQAAEVLIAPTGQDGRPVPRLADLMARRGDPAKGAQVFRRPEVNCIGCHLVNGEGVLLGSDLSDIATRMDRESLFENILDPSAVVTKGYESWQVILQNEDEYVGVLAGETETELALRDAKNNLIQLKKAEIKVRRQLTVSLMPNGLQQSLTTQDLVDLVAYLGTLNQSPKPENRNPK